MIFFLIYLLPKEASHESPRVKATPSNSANISSPHQPPCQQNSDSILQEEDVEISEINVDTVVKGSLEGRQPIGDNSSSGKSAAGTKSGRNKKTKSNTVIVGDSMIKYVKGWEISSATNRVTVKSFSGASVEDMTDFIKPILRKKPENIVLHIGTNNLRNDDAKSVADGITNLAHSIQQQCPDIEIIVSGVITRSDDMSASSRVRETNKLVKSMCDQNDWNFIPNSNIKNTHLNVRGLRDFVNRDTLISIYNALINPHFDYCSEVWDTMGVGLSNRLQKLQNRAARVIMNFSNDISGPEAIKALGWESLETRRAKSKAKTMYKVLNNLAQSSLAELFEHKRNITKYDLRGSSTSLQLPQPKTEKLKKSFSYDGAKLWNSLPVDVRNSETLTLFKERIRAHTVQ